MFRVLKPVYRRTGEVTQTAEGPLVWHRVEEFELLGLAHDMHDANQKYPRGRRHGYSHVLEEVGPLH